MRARALSLPAQLNRDITVWFLSQRALPPVATVIPFYLVMRAVGLLDTHIALILINAICRSWW